MDTDKNQEAEYINSNCKLGKLILKVEQIHKKPVLDNSLSEVLDVFLQKLRQSEDFLVNGIFQINFAEAALLLQSSAFIYSKKVDLLWDAVNQCQKRLISFNSEENKRELKRLEERELKYKRKRKVVEVTHSEKNQNEFENFNIDWNDVNEWQHSNCERDSRLFSDWHKKMVVNWDLQPISKECKTFAEKCSHFRSSNNSIHDKDNDDEFVVQTAKMESVMGLEELFLQQKPIFQSFSFEAYTQLYLVPNFLQHHELKFEDLEKFSDKFEKIVNSYKERLLAISKNVSNSISSPESRQVPQKLRRISITSTVISKLSRADFDKIYSQECQVNLLRLSVDDLSRLCRLSVDEVRNYSEPQHVSQDSNVENFQENCSADNEIVNADISSIANITEVEGGADNSLCTNEVANFLTDQIDIVHCVGDVPSSTAIQNFPDLTDNNCDIQEPKGSETTEDNVSNVVDEVENILVVPEEKRRVSNRTHDIVKKVCCCEGHVDNFDEDHFQIPLKRRRLSKAALKKLATGITVNFKEFSLFFATHYTPEDGEGQVEIPEFDIDDPIESSSRIDPDEDLTLSQLTANVLCTQDSGYESRFLEANEEDDIEFETEIPLSPSNPQIPDDVQEMSNEACTPSNGRNLESIQTEVQSFEMSNCLPDAEKPLHERVYEWKQYMSEKFKKMNSADFDIHKYGSDIMQNLESERPKKFGDIVRGKSSAEVTRFFISALQLANTSNVDIEGVQAGKLSNDTFSLKLITRDCYYDRLKSYVAPSEENFRERLESAQKLKKKREYPSTSDGSVGHKRSRYE